MTLFERHEGGFKEKWKKQEPASCWGVALSPAESWIAYAVQGDQEAVRVWDFAADRKREFPDSQKINGQTRGVAFSPDGKFLAVGTQMWGGRDRIMARLWETTGPRKFRELMTPGKSVGSVRSVSFSSDGTLLAASDDNASPGTVVWELPSGKPQWHIDDKTGNICSSDFARSQPVFANTRKNTVQCYTVPKFELLGKKIEFDATVEPEMIALSPSGKLLAIKLDSRVELYDVVKGQLRHRFDAPASAWSLAFTPDGKNLIAGHIDKLVRVWVVPDPM